MQNKRVMLKLSGEALAKPEGGYNEEKVRDIAKQLQAEVTTGEAELPRLQTEQRLTRSECLQLL